MTIVRRKNMAEKILADIEAGDEVIVKSSGLSMAEDRLVKVDRTTRTQIIVGNCRYNRFDGRVRGSASSYTRSYIEVPTKESRAQVLLVMKRGRAASAAAELQREIKKLPESVLDKILEAYREAKAAQQ